MGWTAIRVSDETKADLERLRETLIAGEDRTRCGRLDPDSRDRIGLDQVIRVLLAERSRWNERKKKAAAKARAAKKTAKEKAEDGSPAGDLPAGQGPTPPSVYG